MFNDRELETIKAALLVARRYAGDELPVSGAEIIALLDKVDAAAGIDPAAPAGAATSADGSSEEALKPQSPATMMARFSEKALSDFGYRYLRAPDDWTWEQCRIVEDWLSGEFGRPMSVVGGMSPTSEGSMPRDLERAGPFETLGPFGAMAGVSRSIARDYAKAFESLLRTAISRLLGETWTIDDIKGRLRSERASGAPFEVFLLDGSPILEVWDAEPVTHTLDDLSSRYAVTRRYRFLV